MKNKIALKLTLYFTLAILLFALVVGSAFWVLFSQHTEALKREELNQRAVKIAQALAEHQEDLTARQEQEKHSAHMQGLSYEAKAGRGYGSLLRFLSSSAADDVWIVDEKRGLQMQEHKERKLMPALDYKDLPADADQVIRQAFEGEVNFGLGFSEVLRVPTLTVGAPIAGADGKVWGVVLIHSPVSGMKQAAEQGMKILFISTVIAALLVFILSLVFSWKFTKPLKTMQRTAEQMAEGDYSVRNLVRQKDELGELGTALDILGERLEAASQESAKLDQLRRDFIANISHELRTPVTVIRGSLEALSDGVVTSHAQVKEYYRQMLAESIFLQRLINDLLDLSRLQNSSFKIEKNQLNFCEVVQDVVRSSQHLGQAKEVNVVVTTDTQLYAYDGDYGRLRQMLMIFLDNAIKFSPAGGQVEVTFTCGRLTITDHGVGIKAEALRHVFERFYKTRVEKNKSGTGLGLAIAKEIAERHGIIVGMDSEPGVYTRVTLSF
ncbi:MAG: ATP-binding protein [Acidaminococcaceae bacterium]